MRTLLIKGGIAMLALGLALGLVELGLAAAGVGEPGEFTHEQYFESAEREATTFAEAIERGEIEVGNLPRGRANWAKEHTFYICYRGAGPPDFDDRGCVRVDINRHGIRDRADLTEAKPAGERRVVCLGDSFTFGWGVAEENTWVRLAEAERRRSGDVRLINCGAAGSLMVDEHWWRLRDRWHRFDPDVVLVSICLNDLAPLPDTVGLFRTTVIQGCAEHGHRLRWSCAECVADVSDERYWRETLSFSRLAGLMYGAHDLAHRLELDPAVDWGAWLLEMPEDWAAPLSPTGQSFYELQGMPPEAAWKNGGPQRALRELRDWCAAGGVKLGVVVWPLFQGLETRETYPFSTMHEAVAAFCAEEGIASRDLLDVFAGRESSSLWVDPADMHASAGAHSLAAPTIAAFLAELASDR